MQRLSRHALVSGGILIIAFSCRAVLADFMFSYGGHRYLTVTAADTWANAAADAAGRQSSGVFGELATIDSQAENDAILAALLANIPVGDFASTAAPDGGNGSYVWIGATDRQAEGQWLWDGDGDGTGVQFWQGTFLGASVGGLFQNWGDTLLGQNEPDDFFMNQDAAGISLNGWPLGDAGEWNDIAEANALYYLVEFAVPEPASALLAALGLGLSSVLLRSRVQRDSR